MLLLWQRQKVLFVEVLFCLLLCYCFPYFLEEFSVYLLVVFILFFLPLICGKRAACHYICWMAPFMNLGIKIRKLLHLPGLRIATDHTKCVDCKICTKNCPMGLDVHQIVKEGHIDEYECSMCGECIDQCPKKAISYKFKGKDNCSEL